MIQSAIAVTDKLELDRCETVIERGLATFYEVGTALLTIRDQRLYRASHSTFEDYCRERWQWGRHRANRLIEAAAITDNLVPIGTKPTHESQIRPLSGLDPKSQRTVWTQAVAESNGQPTAAKVEEVSKTFKQVFNERVAARSNDEPPGISRRELSETRDRMKVNAERVHQLMNFIRAIETLSTPTLPIPEVAHEIIEMDTPDKNWRHQASIAKQHLTQLVKEMNQ